MRPTLGAVLKRTIELQVHTILVVQGLEGLPHALVATVVTAAVRLVPVTWTAATVSQANQGSGLLLTKYLSHIAWWRWLASRGSPGVVLNHDDPRSGQPVDRRQISYQPATLMTMVET